MSAALFAPVDASLREAAAAVPLPATDVPDASIGVVHGAVVHTRHRPATHAFSYPAFCLRLPLSRLHELAAGGIGYNRRGAVTFHDCDHGPRDGSPLLPWIRALLAAEGIAADGEIVLYAFPRMLGYVFNPVSFWICHDRNGGVRGVLCEVSNTFGEHHNYLLAHADGGPLVSGETLVARKAFHVSPFCAVQGQYAFRFHFGVERWLARIDYFDDEQCTQPLLETRIAGRSDPLDRTSVRRLLWRYRFFTFGVVARIHWQALKLLIKGTRFFKKPAPPIEQTSR